MSLVLATDTSTAVNTIALVKDAKVIAELSVNVPNRHAERLIGMTDGLLKETGIALQEVDIFAVSIGPGSFTGLRIGVSSWKGLAFGCDKPLVGVCSLDALARSCGIHNGRVAVVIDARMKEVYGAVYRIENGRKTIGFPMQVGPVEALLEKAGTVEFVVGDGAIVYRDRILACAPEIKFANVLNNYPRAGAVALEAVELLAGGASGDPGAVSPVYLRQSQPEEARKLEKLKAVPS